MARIWRCFRIFTGLPSNLACSCSPQELQFIESSTGGNVMELKLSQRNVSGVTVVECSGRIIFGDEAALLRETVKAMLPDTRQIVLNLKNVSYIDSGGLGTLVGLY